MLVQKTGDALRYEVRAAVIGSSAVLALLIVGASRAVPDAIAFIRNPPAMLRAYHVLTVQVHLAHVSLSRR